LSQRVPYIPRDGRDNGPRLRYLEAYLKELGGPGRRCGADKLLAPGFEPDVGAVRAAKGDEFVPALDIEQLVWTCEAPKRKERRLR
jgi:hypothetical protein